MSIEKFSEILNSTNKRKSRDDKLSSDFLYKDSFTSLETKDKTDILLFSEDTKISIRDKDLNFLNYLSNEKIEEFKKYVGRKIDNPELLYNSVESEISNVDRNDRAYEIFRLVLKEKYSDVFGKFIKIRIKTSLNVTTAYRLFAFYDDNTYKKLCIFLIDPLHLVLPDKRTKEDNVYKNCIGKNDICMSTILK